jgi:nucleoside-triphosphatase THEP1
MARVVVVYGPRGAGKTTTTLRLAERFASQGLRVGGFFQRATTDTLGRRGYELVRYIDRAQMISLAQPGVRPDEEAGSCSFVFARDALAAGFAWLREDAAWADVLVIDEVSKFEVAGEGHEHALRWALALPADRLLLLSVRADQLVAVVEQFALMSRLCGEVELPVTDAQLDEFARRLVARRDDEALVLRAGSE